MALHWMSTGTTWQPAHEARRVHGPARIPAALGSSPMGYRDIPLWQGAHVAVDATFVFGTALHARGPIASAAKPLPMRRRKRQVTLSSLRAGRARSRGWRPFRRRVSAWRPRRPAQLLCDSGRQRVKRQASAGLECWLWPPSEPWPGHAWSWLELCPCLS